MTATITSDTARLPVMLTQLRLPTVARLWPTISETADRDGWPAARTLAALLEHEIAKRAQRRIRDCQEFRVRAMTTGRKEPAHGTPQSTPYPGRAAGPASGRP